MRLERHHLAWVLASTTTVVCFVGATAYTQVRLARLDAVASTLETDAIPSIEYLGRTGVRLTKLNQLIGELAAGRSRAPVQAEAGQVFLDLDRDVTRYARLPPLVGEREHWSAVRADVSRALELSRIAFDDEEAGAAAVVRRQAAEDALDAAVSSVLTTVNYDTVEAEQMAQNVRSVRLVTLRAVVALDAGSAVVAALAVVLAFRASRAHDALLKDHASLLSARVAELDSFAGRIAHDVLSPLGSMATALSLLGRSTDAAGRRYVDRSLRAVFRVQQLVDDLLAFARSGGRPDGSECCSIETVIDSLKADLADAAESQGILLVYDVGGPMPVRCAAGVVTSVVQNLVRNAIKYMGTRPVKRISVAAGATGSVARIEILDTGPGIPPEMHTRVFDPFVRGVHEGIDGSGLGLATVKRLVESHGGRVGLESRAGGGTCVWVELPLALDRPNGAAVVVAKAGVSPLP